MRIWCSQRDEQVCFMHLFFSIHHSLEKYPTGFWPIFHRQRPLNSIFKKSTHPDRFFSIVFLAHSFFLSFFHKALFYNVLCSFLFVFYAFFLPSPFFFSYLLYLVHKKGEIKNCRGVLFLTYVKSIGFVMCMGISIIKKILTYLNSTELRYIKSLHPWMCSSVYAHGRHPASPSLPSYQCVPSR